MEDPAFTTLTPQRLVMTTSACFYCGAVQAKWTVIEYLFGLNACSSHAAAALRDCRAYMHEKKMVKFSDAYKHPILGSFLKMLKDVLFPVLRSSGDLQEGWSLNTFDTFIMHTDGEWMVPVHRVVNGEETFTKYTPIFNLKLAGIFDASLIDETVFCLIDGIYTKEYETVQIIRLSGVASGVVPEIAGVVEIMYEGQVGRVMVPGGSGSAASQPLVEQAENPC